MSKKLIPKTSTDQLIRKLRLMGEVGGMLSKDRIRVVLEAADRLEELDERVDIIMETVDIPATIYPVPISEVTRHES